MYLDDDAFREGLLRIEIGLAIQRELASIDPAPFRGVLPATAADAPRKLVLPSVTVISG